MYTKRASAKKLYYKPNSNNKVSNLTNEQIAIKRLQTERRKIRAQLTVGSFVDNWPNIKVVPEKLRGKLFHRLRLVDEALSRINKICEQLKAKKRRLSK